MTDDTFQSVDSGMLDLFRVEAEKHAAELENTLLSFKDGVPEETAFESLIRAAGAIKGAAMLVGLDGAAGLAGALETVFSAARDKKITLDEIPVQTCRRGIALFIQVSRMPLEEMPGFFGEKASEFEQFRDDINGLLLREPQPASPEKQDDFGDQTGQALDSALTPLAVDDSMWDLFRMEAEIHAGTMITGLSDIGDGKPGPLDALRRAAHSIRGAAGIVGLDSIANPAKAMEAYFETAEGGGLDIHGEGLGLCRQGAEIFHALSKIDAAAAAGYLGDVEKDCGEIAARLHALLGGAKAPDSVAAPQPPAPKRSTTSSLADASMMDLFQIEAASHAASLESGLLSLETKSGDLSKIEPLMRAAHSIKGAARIVGLDQAVSLAHVMEDFFVAVQGGQIEIGPEAVDVCLNGVDLFKNISLMPAGEIAGYLTQYEEAIGVIEQELKVLLKGEAAPADRAAVPKIPPAVEAGPVKTEPGQDQDDQTVNGEEGATIRNESAIRVSADRLSRLMGLAGECLVQGRSLESFSQNLGHLKQSLQRMSDELNSLSESLDPVDLPPDAVSKLSMARERNTTCWDMLLAHQESFESFWLGWENLVERLFNEAVATRMRPFKDGAKGLPRLVRDAARRLNKKINLVTEGENTRVDRDILAKLEAPLNHIVRNACDHGIGLPADRLAAGKPEAGTIRIEAAHRAGLLLVGISDDGRGIDPEMVRKKVIEKGLASSGVAGGLSEAELMEFLFVPGFSTADAVTEISGRGVGLDVVQDMVQGVGGVARVTSEPGRGTSFFLQLPLTRSVIRTLVVDIMGEPYAIPLTRIDRVLDIELDDVDSVEDRMYYHYEGHNIGLMPARQALGLPMGQGRPDTLSLVIISDRLSRYGLVVDRFLGERDLVVRPLDPILEKVPNISAGSILENGDPVLIIDVDDLVRSIDNILGRTRPARIGDAMAPAESASGKRVLVVDDSITVREVERRLLENHGYEVDVAVDGMDGWNAARTQKYDLLISDVDMPRMNGLEMVGNIKRDPKLRDMPVIIVSYKEREEDRLKGLEVGADYYLTKGSFYDETFIRAVVDLIGEP